MVRGVSTGDLWWKNAVIYCVDVETYYDSDGDGIGDLAGLTQRIDYLAELGVTCLWLMPFYPTPDRDDGYDVTDLFGVDSRLGTHGDLVELLRTANDRGIRVIADLVVNHTSAQHPWFKAARRSKDNPYRDYYVWRADPPPDTSDKVVFPDKEDSIWELDERTGEWYLHHFYSHQPDLNFANPEVRDHIAKSIGFWLRAGAGRLPRRRRAVPHRRRRHRRRRRTGRPARVPEGAAVVPRPAPGRRDPARRGQPAAQGAAGLLRGLRRRRAHHDVRLHRHAGDVPRAGARGRPAARQGPQGQAEDPPGLPVGDVRAQPRRADPRQALRRGAPGGLRRLRTRARHADLRPRPQAPAADHAGRRPPADPHGLQPALQPSGHPDALLRRGDRDGRGPRGRGPDGGAHADAVGAGPQRRLLHRSPAPPGPAAGARTATAPSTSTWPTRSATRTRSGPSCAR